MKHNEFIEYIMRDLLSSCEGITARAMFGCFSIYKNGVIFAIVADDELYFKVGAGNQAEYEAMESNLFSYIGKTGKKVMMPYWRVPAEILEDKNALTRLAEKSFHLQKL